MSIDVVFIDTRKRTLLELSKADISISIILEGTIDIDILNLLITKHKAGLSIIVYRIEETEISEEQPEMKELMDLKCPIISSQNKIIEKSFCLIDNNSVIIESFNILDKQLIDKEPAFIIREDLDVINTYNKRFKYLAGIAEHDYNEDTNDKKIINRINIEKFKRSNSQIISFIDPKILGLQFVIFDSENILISLESVIFEKEQLLIWYSKQFQTRLGELYKNVLHLKMEYFRKNKLYSTFFESEYEKSRKKYNEFSKEQTKVGKQTIFEIDDEDKKKIKELYYEAVKLCHPDKVDDKYKLEAESLFKELADAYQKNDINKVIEWLSIAKAGDFTSSITKSNDINLLILKKESLKKRIYEVKKHIYELLNSEEYRKVIDITDIEEYFKILKTQLEQQNEYWRRKLEESTSKS